MDSKDTQIGKLIIDERPALFAALAEAIKTRADDPASTISVGLTGGSTPKAWYRWAAEQQVFSPKKHRNIIWAASDERRVPLEDPESNFGNAYRLMLDPLGFPEDKFFPWPIEFEPPSGAIAFESQWATRFGTDQAFHICFLGMGDDCHTASLFPGSLLIPDHRANLFAAVEVEGKGWRYTLTPRGLGCCDEIYLLVTGEGKKDALKIALEEDLNPEKYPVQLLGGIKDRVTVLADPAAASEL